jgi:hypothetical protein
VIVVGDAEIVAQTKSISRRGPPNRVRRGSLRHRLEHFLDKYKFEDDVYLVAIPKEELSSSFPLMRRSSMRRQGSRRRPEKQCTAAVAGESSQHAVAAGAARAARQPQAAARAAGGAATGGGGRG